MENYEDNQHLTRELDKVKSNVFIGKSAAFLGSLLCSLSFKWDSSIETAATDGSTIFWSPEYFLRLPPDSRKTDLIHELWHVAYLHNLRRGNRCPDKWNIACDIKIDLDLEAQGFTFIGIEGVLTFPDLDARQYIGWVEEDIYDDLNKPGALQPPPQYKPDLKEPDPKDLGKVINAVVKAIQQAKLADPGSVPGELETIITKFLTPIVPWEQLLHRFMSDLIEGGYSWRKPNRRFTDMYLPSKFMEEGALDHLAYFEDSSGSISDDDAIRFNSEFKYVKETYSPKKMTLIQFDTRIQSEHVYLEDDPFDQVVIKGRGGTHLHYVREWIIEHKPTAAVIFSDLGCAPMQPLGYEIPIIWVCISNHDATVPFGQLIHIK